MMPSMHAKRDPSVDPLVGQTLANRYLIKRLIGAGGVGLVYLAQDNDANRPVVVKVLAPNWADNDEALARFEREARRLNDLEHPNIVRLFSFGNENGRAYIVMEYADGELLSSYVKRKGRLELRDFVPIASQILKGMGYSHARGLMLRDVKPANIMLTSTGGRSNFVKLLDFGLAKLIEGDAEITQQHVVGTAAYLSPEQIKGEDLDLRVDVYAVGVLFYFMLTGRLPFEADNTANVFYKHVNEAPPPLSETLEPGHDVPDELIEVIHRCLEKDREERPADANEIVEGLIDAVPDLSMFKLPRVAGSGDLISDTFAVTDTGVHSLRPSGAPLKNGAHPVSAEVPADDERSGAVTVAAATATETPQTRSRLGLYIGIGAAVLCVGIVAFALSRGGGDGETAAVTGSNDAADVDVAAELAAVEELVSGAKFDDALAKLDGMAAALEADPSTAGKAKQLRLAADSGKLMVTGRQLEAEADLEAARDVFASVVKMDASNAEARSAVSRIDKLLALSAGKLSVETSPHAYVSIGGKDKGKTPLDLDLQPGEYELVISAEGYMPKTETVKVAKGETVRLKTSLRRAKKRKGSSPTPTPTPTGTGGETPEPRPKPKPKPEPAPETSKPEKSDPFLPSRKSGKNDGFLPTR